MILVTGAAGKTGLAALVQLSMQAAPVRALIHMAEYERSVLEAGAQEVITGDLRDKELVRRALEGVEVVYHIPPNVHPDEFEIGQLLIEASKASGVDLFVYHSVLHPHVEDMLHHWQKMRVEELLFKSGIDFTILQPAAYMQNVLGQWNSIETEGFFAMPYPIETKLSLVDLHDVAEAAMVVLTRDGHRGAIYELVGTRPLSQIDLAALLSGLLGREVRADTISLEAWEQNALGAGFESYAVETLVKMFQYYGAYGFEGNPSVLKWLLGRAPTGFEEAVRREMNL
jgi:NAD(P)H dehydrogenase (quinone)